MYQVYKVVYVEEEPTFMQRTDDDSEYERGPDFIDQIFDFTPLFNNLGYWDSSVQLDCRRCDDALVQIRQAVLRLQSEQVSPRSMTPEERAYYRFPQWWFGLDAAPLSQIESPETQKESPETQKESTETQKRSFLPDKERKKILMRHLLDLYNEIRSIPAFRSKRGERLFYCK